MFSFLYLEPTGNSGMKKIIFEYGKTAQTFCFDQNLEYQYLLQDVKVYFGIDMAKRIVLVNVNLGEVIQPLRSGDLFICANEVIPKYKVIAEGKKAKKYKYNSRKKRDELTSELFRFRMEQTALSCAK